MSYQHPGQGMPPGMGAGSPFMMNRGGNDGPPFGSRPVSPMIGPQQPFSVSGPHPFLPGHFPQFGHHQQQQGNQHAMHQQFIQNQLQGHQQQFNPHQIEAQMMMNQQQQMQHAMRFGLNDSPRHPGQQQMQHPFHNNPNRQPLGPVIRPGINHGNHPTLQASVPGSTFFGQQSQHVPQAVANQAGPQSSIQFPHQQPLTQTPHLPPHPLMLQQQQQQQQQLHSLQVGPTQVMPPIQPQQQAPQPQQTTSVSMPDVPYFDLPAGLMVPMVKLEDWEYIALDPKKVKLPVPAPPSDRLLKAVEAFYAPPSHDRPRNAEGWEQLALYEFYKAKAAATEGKAGSLANLPLRYNPFVMDEKETQSEVKEKVIEEKKEKKPEENKRRFREEKSPSKTSSSPSRSRSEKKSSGFSKRRRSSSSSSGSPRSTSKSPPRRSLSRHSSHSKQKSPAPSSSHRTSLPKRSPSPDSFKPSFSSLASQAKDGKLESSNKGHQLLKKMGWTGAGLGPSEQGIQEPISAGEVRDSSSLYRGIGMESNTGDPFESYRRNRGQQFMDRIVKSRDTDKPK